MSRRQFEIFDSFYNAHWFLTAYYRQSFSELLHYGGTKAISKFIGTMKNDVHTLIFDANEFNQAADFYSERLINDNNWRKIMYEKHDYYTGKYFKEADRFRKLSFKSLSDKQILKEIIKVILLQEWVRVLGIMINGLVIDGRNHLSDKIRSELQNLVKDEKEFNQYWLKLTQVTRLSTRQKKDIEISRLAQLAKKRLILAKEINNGLRKIYEKYCWLDYLYYGPPIPYGQFRTELDKAIKKNTNLALKEQLNRVFDEQEMLMKKLKFNQRAKHLVKLAQYVLWQKGWRKDVEYHGLYCYEPAFKEIARRRRIKDWRLLLFLLPKEIDTFIIDNNPKPAELRERRRFSCLIADKENVKMLFGKKAQDFYSKLKLKQTIFDFEKITGQCAYQGIVKGRVKVIHVPNEMKKMNNGDVLISQATSPDLLPAIRMASAIVTNTGGLICHAAIISRELKIPCIVGTKYATKILHDGDLVEVDANKGIVRKIK